MPHALVTGGAGFIGSHLVDSLLRDQYRVTVLDNFDPFYDRSIKLGNIAEHRDSKSWRLIEGDIRDAAAVNALPDDIDVIVHLAAAAACARRSPTPCGIRRSTWPARRTCWSWRVSAASGSSCSPPRAASTA